MRKASCIGKFKNKRGLLDGNGSEFKSESTNDDGVFKYTSNRHTGITVYPHDCSGRSFSFRFYEITVKSVDTHE